MVGAIATAVLTLVAFRPRISTASPEKEAARAKVDQIYEEELAAARAAALANEAGRQAELNATGELLNSIESSPPLPIPGVPPEAQAVPPGPFADPALRPSDAPIQAPDPNVPPGSVRTKDGQIVDVEAMINSVRAAGSKRDKNE